MKRYRKLICLISMALATTSPGGAQHAEASFRPTIPETWIDEEMASLEVPLANPAGSPKHVSADYYYRIPVRTIYRPYTWYAPGQEPAGYLESLKPREPEILLGVDSNGRKHTPPLNTKEDWIRAGQIVFEAPLGFAPFPDVTGNRMLFEKGRPPVSHGAIPFIP